MCGDIMHKLNANRIDIEPDSHPAANGLNPIDLSNDRAITHSIRIEVYKGNEYMGKKSFSQNRINIGKSLEADLVLSDDKIADKQACITFIDGQLVVLDQTQKTGLLINGALYGIATIYSSEQVGIGHYTLNISYQKKVADQKPNLHNANEDNFNKNIRISLSTDVPSISESMPVDSLEQDQKDVDHFIKNETPEVDLFALFEGNPVEDHERYDLVFEGDIQACLDIKNVKKNLSKILKLDASRVERFLNKKRVVLKSDLEIGTAKKFKKVFEKSGAACRLIAHKSTKSHEISIQENKPEKSSTVIPEQSSSEIKNRIQNIVFEEKPGDDSEVQIVEEPLPVEEKEVWKFYGVDVDEEVDDDEEEDLPATFYLKDKIDDLGEPGSPQNSSNGKYLEILKLHGDDVMDIQHLEDKGKFYILNDKGKRFCLAELKGVSDALLYFNKKLQGNIEVEGRPPVETCLLMKDENCFSKRKKVYRTQVPQKGKVVISDGYFEYQMRIVSRSLVPDTPEVIKSPKKSYRHLGVSLTFHIVFLAFLGLFPSFQEENKVEDEPRFVKFDLTQLAELEKMVNPQPKPKPIAPKPVVKPKLAKKTKAKVLKKQPVRTASKKKPSKVKKSAKPSRHPDAGGGFGEGNVVTRDINETGLLSMLGDAVGLQPRSALAAVTNLDAVSSPNITANNFSVGGVVGKLGTGEIAVPKGAIVATRGSSQVLRSHGRKGEGRVAALEKGATGNQEVIGMVSATLDKTARIRGGLSMDEVRRVIDQHLDDITYCYESELISNPSIVGKVIFEWKIMMSGEVGEVRIKSSSINSHDIHACIKDSIRTWRFPKPRGAEVMVSYPFVFDIVGF